MRTSTEVDKIAPALAAAQAKLQNPVRNKTATVKGKTKGGASYEYEYKYASLDLMLDNVRPVFAELKLFIVQGVVGDQPPYKLVTRITHESGQWQETEVPLAYSGSYDPQEFGISQSYSRRYGLAPMLGIAPEEDTDASKAGAKSAAGDEGLDAPTRNRMTDIATVVQDWAKAGKWQEAKDEWEKSDFRDLVEAKNYAWKLLPAKTRTTIKELQLRDRVEALEKEKATLQKSKELV